MTEIPEMTDPLGQYWEQPQRSEILVDDTHAVMTTASFRKLKEYSSTLPTGKYIGKMWCCRDACESGFMLCWYGPDPEPDWFTISRREILFV